MAIFYGKIPPETLKKEAMKIIEKYVQVEIRSFPDKLERRMCLVIQKPLPYNKDGSVGYKEGEEALYTASLMTSKDIRKNKEIEETLEETGNVLTEITEKMMENILLKKSND